MTEQLRTLLDSFRKPINNDRFDYSYERNYNDVIDDIQRRLAKVAPVAPVTAGDAGGEVEQLGRFGHHPDPAIDFCVELDCLEGLAYEVKCGTADKEEVSKRIFSALMFRVGGDEGAVKAKQRLCELDATLATLPALSQQPVLRVGDVFEDTEPDIGDLVLVPLNQMQDIKDTCGEIVKKCQYPVSEAFLPEKKALNDFKGDIF